MEIGKLKHAEMTVLDIDQRDTVYISGKMSGELDMGKATLDEMESVIRGNGHKNVMNPYYMVDQSVKLDWCDCMKIDIRDIMNFKVKACFLCDNWRESKGATLEVILFLALGIPLFDKIGNNITYNVCQMFTPEFLHTKFIEMVETHRCVIR